MNEEEYSKRSDIDRAPGDENEARRIGIKVLPPDIHRSGRDFAVEEAVSDALELSGLEVGALGLHWAVEAEPGHISFSVNRIGEELRGVNGALPATQVCADETARLLGGRVRVLVHTRLFEARHVDHLHDHRHRDAEGDAPAGRPASRAAGRPRPELIFGDLWEYDPAPETADRVGGF